MKLFKSGLNKYWPFGLMAAIVGLFFYQTIIFGRLPFPGDILLSEYKPWQKYAFSGFAPGAIPNKAQYPDTIRQIYPWKTLSVKQMRLGKIPLWNPYNFSGTPLLANFQSAVFYPLNIIYFLVNQPVAWTITVILQPLLAMFFMYAFLKSKGFSGIISVFGGFTYAFSYYSIVWLEYNTIIHLIVWLPLELLAISRISEHQTGWKPVYLTSLVFPILAGHPQIFGYLTILNLVYAWHKKCLKQIIILGLFAGLICAVQILPGIELILNSARSPHDYSMFVSKILLWPWHLIMLVVPDFFGNPATRNYWLTDTYIGKVSSVGFVPFFLFILGLISGRIRLKNPVMLLFITILALVTVNPLSLLFYRLPLPFISASSPNLMVFILEFCLAILACITLADWMNNKIPLKQLLKTGFGFIILFIGLWVSVLILPKIFPGTWTVNLLISRRPLLYESAILLTVALIFVCGQVLKIRKPLLLTLLFLIHIFDLFYAFSKFNPFVPQNYIFPEVKILTEIKNTAGLNRFWGIGSANFDANFASQYDIYDTGGYDPLYPKIYGRLIHSSGDGKIPENFNNSTRSDAYLQGVNRGENITANRFRNRLMTVMNIGYILDHEENASTSDTLPPQQFKQVYSENGWRILKNNQALPRVYSVNQEITYSNDTGFASEFYRPEFNPAESVMIDRPCGLKPGNGDTNRIIKIDNYETDRISVSSHSQKDAVLILSDTYYPGWKAFIDDRETLIRKANYAFRAVCLPKGDHRIIFKYEPDSFRYGLYLSSAGIIIGIYLLFRKYRPDKTV